MIASQVKKEDREYLVVQLDVLSAALVAYERTKNPELLPIIHDLNDHYETLKAKIDTHDYTDDQKRYDKITRDLDEAFNNTSFLEAVRKLQ